MKTKESIKIIMAHPVGATRALGWEIKYYKPRFVGYCSMCGKVTFKHDLSNEEDVKEFKLIRVCPSCEKKYQIKKP